MDDGSLQGTGDNFRGQLGLGHENNQSSLQLIMSSGVRHIAAGGRHTLIVKTDGSLWGMGRNDFGQLGLGDQSHRNTPQQILASGVDHVEANLRCSFIIMTDGSLWGMGDNTFGQLGSGTSGPELYPIQLESSGVTQVSAGDRHTLYIKNDGTLWGMGDNNNGELGLGDMLQRSSPVLIDSNVTQVSAGHNHTLYLDNTTSLYAMGDNSNGQLGLGDTISRISPAQVTTGVMRLSGIPPPNLYRSKVTALDKMASDYFGYSVSQSGNILAVGASRSDPDGVSDAGAAYLYQLEANGSATYLTKVTAPDKAGGDWFGASVSQSGNILAVGSSWSDPDGVSGAGAAYLYQLEANGSATYLTKVTAPDKAGGNRFGTSVSQSGNILAVGASGSDPDGVSDAGAAYLYQLEANGSATYLTKVTAPDKAGGDWFGESVSQSGNILAVGATYSDPDGVSDSGAAYLYQLEANGSATYLTKVIAPDKSTWDNFGASVSQSGNILAVGASGSDPDGVSGAGAAYLYQLEANGSATYLTKVTAPDKSTWDNFGASVSQSGNILAVGATSSDSLKGSAYLYQLEFDGSKLKGAYDPNNVGSYDLNTPYEAGMPAVNLQNQVVIATSIMQGTFSNSRDYIAGQVVHESGQFYRIGGAAGTGAWSVTDYDGNANYSHADIVRYSNNFWQNTSGGVLTGDTPGSVNWTLLGASMAAIHAASVANAVIADVTAAVTDEVTNPQHIGTYFSEDSSATYLTKITAPDKAIHDFFGGSVSHSGNMLAVGVEASDPYGIYSAGAVYTYDLSGYVNHSYSGDVTIAGTPRVGEILVADNNLSDADGMGNVTYQWFRDGQPIFKMGIIKETNRWGDGVYAPNDVAISSDGKHAYVTSSGDSGLSWFERNATSGELVYRGTIIDKINGAIGLSGANSILLSPDDKYAYVVSSGNDAVIWYERNASTGNLAFTGVL